MTSTELIVNPPAAQETPAPGKLPQHYYEAYRQKLAGKRINEISKNFGRDRVTVWRWHQQVQREFEKSLEGRSAFNIISEEISKLDDLEDKARRLAEQTTSHRAKLGYLAEARRCCVSRTNLLGSVGVLPKQEASTIFRLISDNRPVDTMAERAKQDTRPRDQLILDVLQKMEQLPTL